MSPDLQGVRRYDSELDLFGLTRRGNVRKQRIVAAPLPKE
jgi:hypothetical protein